MFFNRIAALYGILKHPTVELARLFLKRKIRTGKKNLVSFYTVDCIKKNYLVLLVYFLRYAIYAKNLNTSKDKAKTNAKYDILSKQRSKQNCPQVARARLIARSRHRNYDELVCSADQVCIIVSVPS